MLPPQSNCSFVGGCRFEIHEIHALRSGLLLGCLQQKGTDRLAAVRRENIQRDDVPDLRAALRDDETGYRARNFGHDAVRALRTKIALHLAAPVSDVFWKAQLIDGVQVIEVGWPVRAEN